MFLSTGPLGLVWNMFFLWLFGDNVEDRFTRPGYLAFYLLCGLSVTVLYLPFDSNLSFSAIGITGAVSAVMGAYFVFYPTATVKVFAFYKVFQIPAVIRLGAWFLFQFIYPFLYEVENISHTACFAAIGGFLLGAAVAFFKKLRSS